jgi:hypothetical protein
VQTGSCRSQRRRVAHQCHEITCVHLVTLSAASHARGEGGLSIEVPPFIGRT